MKRYISDTIDYRSLGEDEQLYVYNGMDCAITYEVWLKLTEMMKGNPAKLVYDFERMQQLPAMAMMQMGLLIDPLAQMQMIIQLEREKEKLDKFCRKLTIAMHGSEVNTNSPAQMNQLLYIDMGLPIQRKWDKVSKTRKPTTNRDALQKLQVYRWASTLITTILAMRDTDKQLQTLRKPLDKGRFKYTLSVAGTNTGRWSSSANAKGYGSNGQNLSEKIRHIFIASPGYKLAYNDLEQAESRAVAYLSEDEAYIHACESGDLHTVVCKMVWPDLAWTEDPWKDRQLADKKFYRDKSYRDIAKVAGHGTNYYGQPGQMAIHMQVDIKIVKDFQEAYFKAFPGIARWHTRVARELTSEGSITTPMGLKRTFFGRLNDNATLRKAIAFVPQSLIGYIIGLGAYRIFQELQDGVNFRLCLQVHDAIVFEYKEAKPDLAWRAYELMRFPIPVNGRSLTVPVEMKVGYSWSKKMLAPLSSSEEIVQVRPSTSLLDIRL